MPIAIAQPHLDQLFERLHAGVVLSLLDLAAHDVADPLVKAIRVGNDDQACALLHAGARFFPSLSSGESLVLRAHEKGCLQAVHLMLAHDHSLEVPEDWHALASRAIDRGQVALFFQVANDPRFTLPGKVRHQHWAITACASRLATLPDHERLLRHLLVEGLARHLDFLDFQAFAHLMPHPLHACALDPSSHAAITARLLCELGAEPGRINSEGLRAWETWEDPAHTVKGYLHTPSASCIADHFERLRLHRHWHA